MELDYWEKFSLKKCPSNFFLMTRWLEYVQRRWNWGFSNLQPPLTCARCNTMRMVRPHITVLQMYRMQFINLHCKTYLVKGLSRKCSNTTSEIFWTHLCRGAITSAYYRDLLECISDSVKYQKNKNLGRYFEASN